MCGPRIFAGALSFGAGNAPTVAAGVAGNGALAVAFGAVFLVGLKFGIWHRTMHSRRFASSFLQGAVTEVDDTGVGCFDLALRQ